jgi:hypothetical protein
MFLGLIYVFGINLRQRKSRPSRVGYFVPVFPGCPFVRVGAPVFPARP